MALVLDPATGLYVEDGLPAQPGIARVPGNPTRAAAMQAQAQQPVYGPNNPPPRQTSFDVTNTPAAQPRANPNAINVGQAAADVALGAISTPVAALADLARFRGTQALGGDVGTLEGGVNPRLTAAQNRISGGLSQLGQATSQAFQPISEALSGARSTALGALGAQAAQPAPQPTPVTTPGVTPTTGVQAQQTRPSAGAVGPQPASYAGTGIGVGAQGGEIFRQEGGGVPSFTNVNATPGLQGLTGATGRVVGAPVAADSTQLTGFGGFAPGEARAYLDASDARRTASLRGGQQLRDRLALDISRSELERSTTRGTATDRAAARQSLRALNEQAGQVDARAGGVALAQEERAGNLEIANLQGQLGLQNAQTAAQGAVLAEQVRSQGGANLEAGERAVRERFKNQQIQALQAQAIQLRQQGTPEAIAQAAQIEQQMQTLLTGNAGQPTAKPVVDALGRVTGFTAGSAYTPADAATIEAQRRVAAQFNQ